MFISSLSAGFISIVSPTKMFVFCLFTYIHTYSFH